MSLHLVKLCVGVSAIEELQAHVDFRLEEQRLAGKKPEQYHVTRMVPKRMEELLNGGSLYWVIKGNIQLRQHIADLRPFRDGEGINRCKIVLEPRLIATQWQPRRAFQGWRYLKGEEAPADLQRGGEMSELPPQLRAELDILGLR